MKLKFRKLFLSITCFAGKSYPVSLRVFFVKGMAKRKRKTKKTKQKPVKEMFASLKRMFIMACILLVCIFALLYVYEYTDPQSTEKAGGRKEITTPDRKENKKELIGHKTHNSSAYIPPKAEIPVMYSGEKEQIVEHEGYTLSFNPVYKVANWVAYELTAQEVQTKKSNRFDKFLLDPAIKGGTALNEDYTRTGYDRGHLAPAGDMKWSAKAMRESFYLSNIIPQKPKLNRGIWKDLEEQVRDWAVKDGRLLIATGPVIRNNLKRLGKNRVAIPDSMYKVIVSPYGKEPKGIAFLFANKGYGNTRLETLAIPIDSVEKITGIDFFPALPDDLEERVESSATLKKWNFN